MAAWLAITVTSSAFLFAIVTFLLNLYMVLAVFVTKKIKNSPELSLFYARFAIDVLFAVFNGTYQVCVLSHFLGLEKFIHIIIFFITILGSIDLISIRAILVMIITVDRTLAIYVPIKHRLHRGKLSDTLIISLIFGYALLDHGILWGTCGYSYYVPKGCISYGCMLNSCYVNYWLGFEQAMYITTGTFSFLLLIKLFIWNNCSEKQKSAAFSRANRLALIDILIVALFDFVPVAILAKNINYNFEEVGPVNGATKLIGYAIEGSLVARALIRSNQRKSSVMFSRGTH